ncbi:enoyl-CoA hydratase/isomerase family protein [Microbacterium deminutum]|uniref:Enoyl-CoA hydratase/isomerase family protein n=1 Tax=Microbacterium deminutum TaxID=344164 RepID=A0ABN2R6R2_9MICO
MSRFILNRPDPGLLYAEYDNPPVNLLDDDTVAELDELVSILEQDAHLRVVVIRSANPHFFMARYDVGSAAAGDPLARLHRFADITDRLARAPVISIATIRGRARGGGNEVALACDLRYGSLENTILAQPEVPLGLIPAGGGIERLGRLIGRSRALEVIASGNDYDGPTAERYGWVNRALPDDELDRFVDQLAHRLARFDRVALATTKHQLNRHTLVPAHEIAETVRALPAVIADADPDRREAIRERAAADPLAFELDLGPLIGGPFND